MSDEQKVDNSLKQEPRHELLQQMSGKIVALGQKTLSLYQQKQLSNPDLSSLCDELAALEDQILGDDGTQAVPESEPLPPAVIKEMAEPAPVKPPSPVPPIEDEDTQFTGKVCATCNTLLKPGRKFCTGCGQKAETVEQPPPPDVEPLPSVAEQPLSSASDFACADCGSLLPTGSAFCTECGNSVHAPHILPITPPPPAAVALDLVAKCCDVCGLGLLEETVVCPGCSGNTFS